jgi:hypothetical protein
LVVGSHTFLCKPKLKPIIGKNKKLIRKGIWRKTSHGEYTSCTFWSKFSVFMFL